MGVIVHARQRFFQMVEPRVHGSLGNAQNVGHLDVCGRRRHHGLLVAELGQTRTVEERPSFVLGSTIGVGFATGVVLGLQAPIVRLASA